MDPDVVVIPEARICIRISLTYSRQLPERIFQLPCFIFFFQNIQAGLQREGKTPGKVELR
jgi:hypothetical protein